LRRQKFQGNVSKQKREKLSKDKSVCFNRSRIEYSLGATTELKNRKKRKRSEFEESGSIANSECDESSSQSSVVPQKGDDGDDSTSPSQLVGGKLSHVKSLNRFSRDRLAAKQRRLNPKSEVLMLKLQKGKRIRHPFPLYRDADVFNCKTKEMNELLSKNLIEHKQDDDYDTDIDVVDDHVEMCLNDLRAAIEEFVSG
jgi:hypothetical protein